MQYDMSHGNNCLGAYMLMHPSAVSDVVENGRHRQTQTDMVLTRCLPQRDSVNSSPAQGAVQDIILHTSHLEGG